MMREPTRKTCELAEALRTTEELKELQQLFIWLRGEKWRESLDMPIQVLLGIQRKRGVNTILAVLEVLKRAQADGKHTPGLAMTVCAAAVTIIEEGLK